MKQLLASGRYLPAEVNADVVALSEELRDIRERTLPVHGHSGVRDCGVSRDERQIEMQRRRGDQAILW